MAEAEALTCLSETVHELETALAWTEARKVDAETLLERYAPTCPKRLLPRKYTNSGSERSGTEYSDRVYLNDAETMHAVFAERIEQAKAVEPPLPAPDGREIVRWVALPSLL